MKGLMVFATALLSGLLIAGCTTSPTSNIDQVSKPESAAIERKRSTAVVAGRPARMYVWVAFDEKTCSALTPKITVAQKPTKGDVSFKSKQTTTIRHSNSGKCIGQSLPGTGIYYTARNKQKGVDHFSITATTSSGQASTRSFQVQIVE